MAMALVDTSIIVDLLRGYPPAQSWFTQQSDLVVSRIVWLEVLEGAPNRDAQRVVLNLLRRFQVEEIDPVDGVWATQKLLMLNLSHNIDAFDCLMASAS
jgi:predicted nucleic acid-binding protein